MSRIDEIISNALAGIEETEVAILARELLKTREALALAQQAKGCAEGRAALADRRALGMKPHVFAAMVNSVRDLARQYGHMEQFRCRIADLLGKYIHVEHNSKGMPEQTEAQAVVVPELTNAMVDLAVGPTLASIYVPGAPIRSAKRNGYRYGWRDACACLRTIPADRVLGDGMVQVRLEWLRDVLALLMDFDNAPAPVSTSKRLYALLSAPEALVPNNRANQGGLNHVHV